MRASLLILGLSLIANTALAADPAPATAHLPATCAVAASAASPLFGKHGFDVTLDKPCPGCLALETTHLHDLQGHSLGNVRTAMHRYMSIGPEHDVPGAWHVHTHLTTRGNLILTPEPEGCRAQLLFHFSWYATEFLVVVPVDGDPASRPSNLRLETEYLNALKP